MNQLEYAVASEEFLTKMNGIRDSINEDITDAMKNLCNLMGVSKVEVKFSEGKDFVNRARAKHFMPYNDGEALDKAEIEVVKNTEDNSRVVYLAYRNRNVAEWNEVDRSRIELMLNVLFIFNGRSRLIKLAEMYAFNDEHGYKNVRFFVKKLNEFIRSGNIENKACIQFNLKRFALVNDQIGREAGDVAMKNYIRSIEEAAGAAGVVCRMGGDNFIMITPKNHLDEVVNRLNGREVRFDDNSSDKTVVVRSTAGIVVVREGFTAKTESALMDMTMATAQIAKHSENRDIVYYDSSIEEGRERINALQKSFPEAVKAEEFVVYYQPKVDIVKGELSGAEALCRWMKDGKLVPPGMFIPILEQSLDICTLDFYMLEHTCRDIRRWLDEGRQVVRVSVNLSRRHLVDEHLLQHLLNIIDKYNVPHKYIEVELTETTTDVNFTDLKRIVHELGEAGIATAIDDFGIGYSSLNLIREIPWTTLKVDKCFVPTDVASMGARTSILFKHVIEMTKEVGLDCVVEGIETVEQVKFLREAGCQYAQGFLYDKPLPVKEFEWVLDRHTYDV